jgi:hypothetical protein
MITLAEEHFNGHVKVCIHELLEMTAFASVIILMVLVAVFDVGPSQGCRVLEHTFDQLLANAEHIWQWGCYWEICHEV